MALAEGVRLVEELLQAGLPCKGAVISPTLESTSRGADLVMALRAAGTPLETVTDQEIQSLAATENPQGVVVVFTPARLELSTIEPEPGRPVLLLDGVQDPGNVGTILRTSLAFGAAGVVALPGTADLLNPKTLRASMGASFRLPALHASQADTLEWLQQRGLPLWVAGSGGTAIGEGPERGLLALVLGNEAAGVSPDLFARADRLVTIPIRPEVESLNVAIAAGILLYQVTR